VSVTTALSVVASVAAFALLAVSAPGPAAGVGPPAPTQGLVLHYAFESLANGVVTDLAGNSLDGHVVAAAGSPSLVNGLSSYGKAVLLTGANHQYVDVPLLPALDVNTYTLSAWVRYSGVQNDKTLERWEVLEKADAYWMNIRTNGLVRVGGFYGGCTSAAWKFFDSTKALPKNTWKNVVTTYDGARLRVFIDGKAAGSLAVSGSTCVSGQPLAIGAKNKPSQGLLEAFFDGRLDDVRIYNRALSTTEVSQLAARP
jgi:Concanavalin A-like lectin/glucanases superfamily